MGDATVVLSSREELQRQFDELIARLGGRDLESARHLADSGVLTEDEYEALRRAENIAWLLDEQ